MLLTFISSDAVNTLMNLAKYLEKHNLSQTEFAARLGRSQGLVWQWLNGHRPIAATQALAIERITGGEVSRYELRPDVYPREIKKTSN